MLEMSRDFIVYICYTCFYGCIVTGKSYDRRIHPLPDRSYRICGTDPELRRSGDHRSHNPADRNLHAESGRQIRVCPLGHRLTVSQALTPLNSIKRGLVIE